MLKLSQVRVARTPVEIPREYLDDPDSVKPGENHILVRGLSILDIGELVRVNNQVLEEIWVEVVGSGFGDNSLSGTGDVDLQRVVREFLMKTPSLMAHIILLATDEDVSVEALDGVYALPGSVQIIALREIALLTFHSEEQLGKVLGVFKDGWNAGKVLLRLLGRQTALESGIGVSEKA